MLNKKIIIDFASPRVRKKILISGTIFLILISVLLYFALTGGAGAGGGTQADEPQSENDILLSADDITEEQEFEPMSIYVDVSGAVNKPSVIALSEGSRVIDAIEAAGGLKDDADLTGINRAEILEDGAYLYVPTEKEVADDLVGSAIQGVGGSGSIGSTSEGGNSGNAYSNQGKININTADSNTLQQLNGVGPATAEKIIDYRNSNGRFKKIEDLKNVSGIGDKTFEKMAAYIKV